jgi:hypothetical protein
LVVLDGEESVQEVPTFKYGELPVLDDQNAFSKTGSVTLDANNYGKVLVNLSRSHVQTCKNNFTHQ